MAGESKQIYQLTNGTFNGSSLVPFEVPNTDSSTSAEKPYITRKTTGDAVSEFVAKTQEFETDLQTDDKTIIGAINELKEGGGGNANYVELTQAEYDELTEEEKHNGKMYFITDGGSDGSIIDDETTGTETTWSSQKISEELETEMDNIENRLLKTKKVSGTTGEVVIDGSGQIPISFNLPSGSVVVAVVVMETRSSSRFPVWVASYTNTNANIAYLNHRGGASTMDFDVVAFYL